jgi:hypothetical protein
MRWTVAQSTSVLLQPRKQRRINVTSFRHSKPLYSLSVPFKPTNNFGSVFTSFLDRGIYETKLPKHVSFFFISRIPLNVPWTWFVAVAMVSVYHSPVSAGIEK